MSGHWQMPNQSAHDSFITIKKQTKQMENELICGLTPDQINELKARHGALFLVSVVDEAGEYKAVCKEPSMDVIQASATIGKSDEMKASLALYDNCVLAKDTAIEKRALLKLQVIKAIGERMNSLSTISKNL